ncbi:MAG TPA: hypothetical protein VNL71_23050 [Chloroflexota bacterium]|nr:hypothetical protein [Chloroflexota bacterium]
MRQRTAPGWRDPLGLALLVAALVVLAVAWHGASPAPSLVITHWHASPAAR